MLRPFPASWGNEFSLPPPLIGLTTSRSPSPTGHPLHGAAEAYIRAVTSAGGLPVLIPVTLSEDEVRSLASRLSGILFTGGGDLHPHFYASDALNLAHEIDEDRDHLELALARFVVERGTPFLGICRGLQVINVALGGALYPDIQSNRPTSLKHDYFPAIPRDYLAHPVTVDSGSRLAGILGETMPQVNSLHHQGIDRLGEGLEVTACAPDGLIEAVELSGHPFGLAVQWHPEWLQEQAPMRRLFQAFVQAAVNK